MPAGEVETVDLTRAMDGAERLWGEITRRHGLAEHPLSHLVNWNFANYAFSNDWDVMSATTKLRSFGFPGFRDSEDMFIDHFRSLQRERIIP